MPNSNCILSYDVMVTIFSLLSKDRVSIYKLLFLSPSYRTYLERMLYRSMTLCLGYPAYAKFLNSVISNKRLASYVRRFGIIDNGEWDPHDPQVQKAFPVNSNIWVSVLQAMEGMVNLKAFVVDVEGSNPPTNRILSLLQRKGRQLHELEWCSGYENSASGPDVLDFLVTQHELRAFRTDLYDCYREEDDVPIPISCCPKLQYLRSPADVVKKFMRGPRRMSIENLLVTLEGDEESLPDFSNIKKLCLWDPPSSFQNSKFPRVESLQMSRDALLEEIDQLSRFPALKEIIAFGMEPTVCAEDLIEIFSTCKRLEVVLIGPQNVYYDPKDPVDLSCRVERWVVNRVKLGGDAMVEPILDGFEVMDCSGDFRDLHTYRDNSTSRWKSRLDEGVLE